MLYGLKTLLLLFGGFSICLAVGANTHPIFAAPVAILFFWAMFSSYCPDRFADYEQEAVYSIVMSSGTAVVVYMCL
ncbi:hypothetical protein [Blastopirellula retiformator]|uniref:Uncharacterized protein n=1 Tax=Blastopirellula retiformator TaxID=2527970 RepID=A0A5C5UXN8_9BACT|nr:hypothetical protein [Blastopirellula retiformator]TWT30918.1 hypothetical protein Enr8_44440 [Blastopirellula retiformator]